MKGVIRITLIRIFKCDICNKEKKKHDFDHQMFTFLKLSVKELIFYYLKVLKSEEWEFYNYSYDNAVTYGFRICDNCLSEIIKSVQQTLDNTVKKIGSDELVKKIENRGD
jgi:hypothetical protein